MSLKSFGFRCYSLSKVVPQAARLLRPPPLGDHYKLETTLNLPFGLKSVMAQLVVRLSVAIVKRLNPSVSKATLISKSA